MKKKNFGDILRDVTKNSLNQSERNLEKDVITAHKKYEKFKRNMLKKAQAGKYCFTTDDFEFKYYPYFCAWAGRDNLLIAVTVIDGIEYLTFAWGEYEKI